MKKIFSLMAALLSAFVFSCAAFADSPYTESDAIDFVYIVKQDGTAVINDYYGRINGELIIPSEIDGYTVTEIGSYCFDYDSSLTSVTVPETVTVIGAYAFQHCYGLETINLSEGLAEIQEGAFQSCLFVQQVDIPDSVTSLGSRSFKDCTYLGNVTIGSGINYIHEETFEGCGMLENIVLGENVRIIGSYAFASTDVRNIYIPKSVERIENNAFSGCYDMLVSYGGGQAQWDKISIRYNNDGLEEAEIRYFMNPDGTVDQKAKNAGLIALTVYISIVVLLIVLVIIVLARKKNGICSHCNAVLEDGAEFCGNCGTKL